MCKDTKYLMNQWIKRERKKINEVELNMFENDTQKY